MKPKSIYTTLIMAFICASFTANADCIKRQCWKFSNGTPGVNGGAMTYGYLAENEAGTTLICQDPGSKNCKWKDGTIPPGIVVSDVNITWDEAMHHAETQIGLGTLTGYVEGDDGSYYSWELTEEALMFERNSCTP